MRTKAMAISALSKQEQKDLVRCEKIIDVRLEEFEEDGDEVTIYLSEFDDPGQDAWHPRAVSGKVVSALIEKYERVGGYTVELQSSTPKDSASLLFK